ncbi:hypothetical protein VTL71DRAFT_13144 [Oculimacula yallundae]|uniref:Uncharacterized protein n=1 Tax=Oculimacula yallundae TaxID=86028 RepID=A0ABR4CQ04_9HELO
MADAVSPLVADSKHNWTLVTSQIDHPEEQVSPQADMKESVDIADVLSKLDNERRERIALDAPQPIHQQGIEIGTEPLISIPFGNGIQVAPGSAPEVSEIESPSSSGPTLTHSVSADSEPKMLEDSSPPPRSPQILGLPKKTFWILALVAIILVLGIIAGTVGGVLSSRRTSKSSANTENLGTNGKPKLKMEFKMQTWENNNQTGRSQIFYSEGVYKTAFFVRSYEWIPGRFADDGNWDACSMSLCQGDHRIGWRGSSRWIGNNTLWNGYEYGDTVTVKCGTVYADPLCPLDRSSVTMTAPIFDLPTLGVSGGNQTVSGVVSTTMSGTSSSITGQTTAR